MTDKKIINVNITPTKATNFIDPVKRFELTALVTTHNFISLMNKYNMFQELACTCGRYGKPDSEVGICNDSNEINNKNIIDNKNELQK
jgi:hypothetical protein